MNHGTQSNEGIDTMRVAESNASVRGELGRGAIALSARARNDLRGATLGLVACLGVIAGVETTFAAEPAARPAQAPAAAKEAKAPEAVQKQYPSPEAAVDALVAAAKSDDAKALADVLGPDSSEVLSSGDPVADQNARTRFLESYEKKHGLDSSQEGKVVLTTGDDAWPFPIPIVKDEGGWYFDTPAGGEEIIARRIGKNELSAIQVCRAYVDAQREYYAKNPEKSDLPHYAQKVASSPGKRDGLYWDTKEGEEESPIGPLMASARSEGYEQAGKGRGEPYHGYYYRVLTSQGTHAKGGAYDYMVRGKLFGGFGLLAYPAEYGNSGVMTFMVNHDGVVFQKDLGPDTEKKVEAIKSFDPDSTWTKIATES
jgi:hypothetical protein